MPDVDAQTEQTTSTRPLRWRLAIAFTTLVTVAGFVVALQQFTLKFLWDESAHTRTVGGVLYMSLGLIGLYLPVRLIRMKEQFSAFALHRQWFILAGIPILYVLAFAACIEASRRSQILILPRPFAPMAVVTYNASLAPKYRNRTSIEFRNAIREHHPTGGFGHYSGNHDGVERFNARFYQDFLQHDREEMGVLEGQTRILEDGRVEITIDVDAKERLRFAVRGLRNVVMTSDGESIDESVAKSGQYKITIVGHTKKES